MGLKRRLLMQLELIRRFSVFYRKFIKRRQRSRFRNQLRKLLAELPHQPPLQVRVFQQGKQFHCRPSQSPRKNRRNKDAVQVADNTSAQLQFIMWILLVETYLALENFNSL